MTAGGGGGGGGGEGMGEDQTKLTEGKVFEEETRVNLKERCGKEVFPRVAFPGGPDAPPLGKSIERRLWVSHSL